MPGKPPHKFKNKELDEIRPARGGVKLKRKTHTIGPKKQNKQEVIQNVDPGVPEEKLDPPTEEASKIVARLNGFKQDLMDSMRAFNKLLNNQMLIENRSLKDTESEQEVVNNLVKAAASVENLQPGEGLMGLCVLSLRQSLSLRDAGNELAHKVQELEKRTNKMESNNNIGRDAEQDKKQLLEQAKKLGLKINFDGE